MSEPPSAKRRYIGFFMSRYFWIGERHETHDIVTDEAGIRAFLARSQELAFRWANEDIDIVIRRDGFVLLRIERLERQIKDDAAGGGGPIDSTLDLWRDYIEHASALMVLISSAVLRATRTAAFTLFPLTNREVFRPEVDDRGSIDMRGISQDGFSALYHFLALVADKRMQVFWLLGAVQVTVDDFAELGPQMTLVAAQPLVRSRLATLCRALGEYQLGSFSMAVVLSFFVIEDALNERWVSWIASKKVVITGGAERINSARMRTMTGRDYTISTVTNLLELQDLVTFEQYSNINKARGWRNKIVHQDPERPSSDDARRAIATALDLVLERTGLAIEFSYALMVPGL